MESCLAGMPENFGPVEVDDIRKDLLSEFTERRYKESDDLSQAENLQVYLRVRPNTVTESNSGESQVPFVSFFFSLLSVCQLIYLGIHTSQIISS